MFRFQHIYGRDHPSAREMLAPGSPPPDGWKQRLRRRRGSPPRTPRPETGGEAVSTPVAPHAPMRSTYGVLEEDEEFYGAGHWVHETTRPALRPVERYRAREVLIHSLKACPWWKPKTLPQHNAAAFQAGLHEKEVKVVPWNEIHPHEIQEVFLDALYRRDARDHHVREGMSRGDKQEAQRRFEEEHPDDPFPPIAGAPDYVRMLGTEADAAELFFTNVALVVRDTLNELLSTEFRAGNVTPGVRVEIESQARIGGGQNASALDFVLSLVSWPLDIKENAFRFHLVSVEMKRPGYVIPADWTASAQGHLHGVGLNSRAHALATQLFWYTRRDPQHVERHLISDYRNSIAVAVEKEMAHESHPEVVMAAVPVTFTRVNDLLAEQRIRTHDYTIQTRPAFQRPMHSPFEGGPRLALLYLAFEALRAYGVLDEKIFPGVRSYLRDDGRGGKGLEPIPVHPAVRMFCKAAPAYEGRHASSPTLGLRAAPHHDSSSSEEDSDASDLHTAGITEQMSGLRIGRPRRRSHSPHA